jgi:hypothetical protein
LCGKFFGVFFLQNANGLLCFHLPHQPDRWALLVRNTIKLLNRVNQCYVSPLHLESGIYVSKNPKMVATRHVRYKYGSFLSFSPSGLGFNEAKSVTLSDFAT